MFRSQVGWCLLKLGLRRQLNVIARLEAQLLICLCESDALTAQCCGHCFRTLNLSEVRVETKHTFDGRGWGWVLDTRVCEDKGKI